MAYLTRRTTTCMLLLRPKLNTRMQNLQQSLDVPQKMWLQKGIIQTEDHLLNHPKPATNKSSIYPQIISYLCLRPVRKSLLVTFLFAIKNLVGLKSNIRCLNSEAMQTTRSTALRDPCTIVAPATARD